MSRPIRMKLTVFFVLYGADQLQTSPGLVEPLETVGTHGPLVRPQQHLKALKKPKGLKKPRGSLAKVPVPSTFYPNGREGRGRDSHPIA